MRYIFSVCFIMFGLRALRRDSAQQIRVTQPCPMECCSRGPCGSRTVFLPSVYASSVQGTLQSTDTFALLFPTKEAEKSFLTMDAGTFAEHDTSYKSLSLFAQSRSLDVLVKDMAFVNAASQNDFRADGPDDLEFLTIISDMFHDVSILLPPDAGR